jgi:electron transfer flavoprotein beta subunit
MTPVPDMPGLNILVCMKFLPDSNQLQADSSTGRPDLKRAQFRINTFDENAIEAGLQLAAQHGGRVIALSLCPQAPPRDVVLKALAMGVNKIYLVTDEEQIAGDTLRIATVLAAAVRAISSRESVPQWDLLICGEASGDEFNEQVGPRLAVALGLPAVTYATRLTLKDRVLLADRALEYCSETIEVNLPVVATVGMEINIARMPTVLQIMGAGRKPIVELGLVDLPDLDIEKLKASPSVEILEVFLPPSTRQQVVIKGDSPQEIVVELLRRLSASGEVNF